MLIEARKFMFTVSLCAMLVVNPVLATAPESDDDLDTTHDVYVESTLPSVEGYQTAGIAGVSYVNRMVDAAGNAAQAAEGHAAAAGAYALSAAESADEAHKVLAGKVDLAQGADNKNKAMVTDDAGSVYAGYIDTDMIEDQAITADKLSADTIGEGDAFMRVADEGDYSGFLAISKHGESIKWGRVATNGIADSAVTAKKIADRAVTADKIADGAIYSGHIANGAINLEHLKSLSTINPGLTGIFFGYRPSGDGTGHFTWHDIPRADSVLRFDSGAPRFGLIESDYIDTGQIKTEHLGSGAVTIDKTDGIVGVVPVGSADATTYANFWIE